jgi:hypothetical protein
MLMLMQTSIGCATNGRRIYLLCWVKMGMRMDRGMLRPVSNKQRRFILIRLTRTHARTGLQPYRTASVERVMHSLPPALPPTLLCSPCSA